MVSEISDADLLLRAKAVVGVRRLSPTVQAGDVGCALVTNSGNVHVGVCLDASCGIGFCAEHAAIANMVTLGESHIFTLVAVDCDGNVLPPCGRCRELISQINPKNCDARVLLAAGRVTTLRKLLPEHWLMD